MATFPSTVRRLSSADGGVLLDLRRGTMLRVNPLGARVLDFLERGESLAEIARKLSTEFALPLDEVQADVDRFFESLKARGVIDTR